MEPSSPSLADLIAALPVDPEECDAPLAARQELQELLGRGAGGPMPLGRAGRIWSLGSLQAKVAAAYLAWWLRSGFQSAEAKRRSLEETHLANALRVFQRMTHLHGAIMKAGQVLSHWPDVLPLPFSEVLGHLHSEAPPMHFSLLREQVRRELGADPLEVFDEFETTACAAASLGQVHRARLKGSGRPVAIKIQYPGVARTIEQDLGNLKAACFAARFSGDWDNLLEQFDSIRRMLASEADYEREADTLELAGRTLAGLDDVLVPRVVRELSTKKVLTMDYLEGRHLRSFLETRPDQAARDRHGAQLSRASFRLWYGARLVYADPHPGNYLFREDGRLGLIDFGCCHHFSEQEFAYVSEMERAALAGDEAAVRGCLLRGSDMSDEQQMQTGRMQKMLDYCDWVWEPILCEGPFDYGREGQFEPGVRLYGEFVKRRWVRSLPVNVWLTRAFFGVRAMLTHLGARVEYGAIMREESARV